MWWIQSKKSGTKYYFVTEEEFAVGRKDTRILIEGDASISRKHASLSLSLPENSSQAAVLLLKDCGSKYGTGVNGKQLSPNDSVQLKDQDIINFGKLDSIWKVVHLPLVAATSCLTNVDKLKVIKLLNKLGDVIISDWNDSCNYLIMNSVMVTIKAVCALASAKRIIHPSFFSKTVECVVNNEPLPTVEEFYPPIGEPALQSTNVSIEPNIHRKDLFKDKKFIFFDKSQKARLEDGIKYAGGTTELFCNSTHQDKMILLAKNTCVMNFMSGNTQSMSMQSQNSDLSKIASFLKKHKKRLISESEIGLAIVHVSAEQFCNPDFNVGAMLFGGKFKIQSQSISEQTIIAPETQQSDILKDTPMTKKRKFAFTYNEQQPVPKTTKMLKPTISSPHSNENDDVIGNLSDKKKNSENDNVIGNLSDKKKNSETANGKPHSPVSKDTNEINFHEHSTLKSNFYDSSVKQPDTIIVKKEILTPPEESVLDSTLNSISNPVQDYVVYEEMEAEKRFLPPQEIKSEVNGEEEIPRNLMKKKIVPTLLRPLVLNHNQSQENQVPGVKNFKKFKKKQVTRLRDKTTRISNLIKYKKPNRIDDLNDWCEANNIVQSQPVDEQEAIDSFEWDAPLKKRR